MPIYEYRCSSCGHEKEVLQKMSDAPLSVCPACGKPTFSKRISAAGFQLKGSGWYATDFRGGARNASDDNKAAGDDKGAKPEAKPKEESKPKEETKSDSPASGSGAASA